MGAYIFQDDAAHGQFGSLQRPFTPASQMSFKQQQEQYLEHQRLQQENYQPQYLQQQQPQHFQQQQYLPQQQHSHQYHPQQPHFSGQSSQYLSNQPFKGASQGSHSGFVESNF